MATANLKSTPYQGVAQAKVVVYTAPTNPPTTSTVIGCICSNTGANPQHASVFLRRASIDYSIITNAPIPNGNTLAVVGDEGKVVMLPGDSIVTICDIGTMDVIASYLEQTP